MTYYTQLNQTLDRLNVPKSISGTSGTSGSSIGETTGSTSGSATGSTSGSASGSQGSSSAPAALVTKLGEFRTHLDGFHRAALKSE